MTSYYFEVSNGFFVAITISLVDLLKIVLVLLLVLQLANANPFLFFHNNLNNYEAFNSYIPAINTSSTYKLATNK